MQWHGRCHAMQLPAAPEHVPNTACPRPGRQTAHRQAPHDGCFAGPVRPMSSCLLEQCRHLTSAHLVLISAHLVRIMAHLVSEQSAGRTWRQCGQVLLWLCQRSSSRRFCSGSGSPGREGTCPEPAHGTSPLCWKNHLYHSLAVDTWLGRAPATQRVDRAVWDCWAQPCSWGSEGQPWLEQAPAPQLSRGWGPPHRPRMQSTHGTAGGPRDPVRGCWHGLSLCLAVQSGPAVQAWSTCVTQPSSASPTLSGPFTGGAGPSAT